MRRTLCAFVCSVSVTMMGLSSFADEIPTRKPYVEEGAIASILNETLVADAQPAADPNAVAAPAPTAEPVATVAPTIRIPDLTGDWCGSWQSCVNGHKGPMRASFCRLCNGNYKVTFTGRFCKLIPFRYSTTLNVTGYTDGVVYLSGSQNLGPIFGTFSYNAWANDRQFASGYSANKDQGQFILAR